MANTLLTLFPFIAAFILQWTTDRWWLAVLSPTALIAAFGVVGILSGDAALLSLEMLTATSMLLSLLLLLSFHGYLAARTMKFEGTRAPVLGPRALWAVVVVLVGYGCYVVSELIQELSYAGGVLAAMTLIAAAGAAMKKSRAQVLIYTVALYVLVFYGWTLFQAIRAGMLKGAALDTMVVSLIPAYLFLSVAVMTCLITYRTFGRKPEA